MSAFTNWKQNDDWEAISTSALNAYVMTYVAKDYLLSKTKLNHEIALVKDRVEMDSAEHSDDSNTELSGDITEKGSEQRHYWRQYIELTDTPMALKNPPKVNANGEAHFKTKPTRRNRNTYRVQIEEGSEESLVEEAPAKGVSYTPIEHTIAGKDTPTSKASVGGQTMNTMKLHRKTKTVRKSSLVVADGDSDGSVEVVGTQSPEDTISKTHFPAVKFSDFPLKTASRKRVVADGDSDGCEDMQNQSMVMEDTAKKTPISKMHSPLANFNDTSLNELKSRQYLECTSHLVSTNSKQMLDSIQEHTCNSSIQNPEENAEASIHVVIPPTRKVHPFMIDSDLSASSLQNTQSLTTYINATSDGYDSGLGSMAQASHTSHSNLKPTTQGGRIDFHNKCSLFIGDDGKTTRRNRNAPCIETERDSEQSPLGSQAMNTEEHLKTKANKMSTNRKLCRVVADGCGYKQTQSLVLIEDSAKNLQTISKKCSPMTKFNESDMSFNEPCKDKSRQYLECTSHLVSTNSKQMLDTIQESTCSPSIQQSEENADVHAETSIHVEIPNTNVCPLSDLSETSLQSTPILATYMNTTSDGFDSGLGSMAQASHTSHSNLKPAMQGGTINFHKKCSLFVGDAGKTALFMESSSQENVTHYDTVVFVPMSACKYHNTEMFANQTAQDLGEDSKQFLRRIKHSDKRTLFVINNLETLEDCKSWLNGLLSEVLNKQSFQKASFLLISRNHRTLCEFVHNQQYRFHEKASSEFLAWFMYPKYEMQYQLFKEFTTEHELQNFLVIPLVSCLVLEHLRRHEYRIPDTITQIVHDVIMGFVNQDGKLDSLPDPLKKSFNFLCKLALDDLIRGHSISSFEDSCGYLSTFCGTHAFSSKEDSWTKFSIEDVVTFGLLHHNIPERAGNSKCYKFLHPLIQEFLAAYVLSEQPPLDQIRFMASHVKNLFEKGHKNWLLFFFGLTFKKQVEFNATKMMVSTLLEVLSHYLDLKNNPEYIPTIIACIKETQENSIWRKVATKHEELLTVELPAKELNLKKNTIASMMTHSKVSRWTIEASARNAEIVKAMIPNGEVTIIEKDSFEDIVKITPRHGSGGASKRSKDTEISGSQEYMLNLFFSKATREILQRVLQLYSKVKLKGDGSSTSYVSFLACECFKTAVEENVTFEPVLPVHFLPVPPKKKESKVRSSKHGESDATALHLEIHDGNAMELVILMKPYFRKIRFVVPVSLEKHSITLSSDYDSVKCEGPIEYPFSNSADKELCECVQESSCDKKKTEMVTAQIPTLGTEESKRKLQTNSSHYEPSGRRLAQAGISDVQTLQQPAISGALYQPFSGQTTSVATQAQSSRRQDTIKPGTVLFTSLPNQIPSDRILQINVDESELIKRGGNGSIFRGNIAGLNVAIKRTHYRSKEFAIITKIQHRNIMPLLAFILGEENPSSRRRFYCFHIMPRLTGDCARMLTDKEEYIMKNLRQKHRDNPRLLGLMQGNLKFIIREVLRGLGYLHSLHIAHRDIKGSNILLKFFCSCNNPLECACDSKYQVVITDFDAAVELDHQDQLPPISATTQPNQYQCIPVGTNGYRAPECSMHVVTNSNDSFSPPVSTKCDIWSLGILVRRMLVGMEGPNSQREMAILILRHHQTSGMVEGVSKRNLVHIDDHVFEDVMQESHVRKEMSWFRDAGNFIDSCLNLNPNKRLSTGKLLRHSFLC